jgi:hypothetical protein
MRTVKSLMVVTGATFVTCAGAPPVHTTKGRRRPVGHRNVLSVAVGIRDGFAAEQASPTTGEALVDRRVEACP